MKALTALWVVLQLAAPQTEVGRGGSRDAEGRLGDKLLAEGFAAEAIPHLETAERTFSLGLAFLQVNRLPEALHKLLAVYAERPDDPEVLFHLGECSGSLMQQSFNRLLKLYPDSPRAKGLQAATGATDVKTLDKALATYDGHPDDPDALFQLGAGARNVMQMVFNRLLRSHPASARAQELQARTLLGQGRGALAEPVFRKALATNPQLPGVHLALGRIFQEERGDLDGAENEYRAEVRLRPGDAEAAWRLGSVLLKKGQGQEGADAPGAIRQIEAGHARNAAGSRRGIPVEDQVAQAERCLQPYR